MAQDSNPPSDSRLPGRETWQVPRYSKTRYRERGGRYCIAVFVIDEGEKLLAQLDRMRALTGLPDILIADGGSTDGSVDDEKMKSRDVTAVLVKTGPGRLGAQMRMAFAYALEEGYEAVIAMDGNNKDDPDALPLFVEALDAGFDYLQGSRFIQGGQGVNTPLLRHWGIKLLHAPMISRAAGFRYTDTTNGFRAYSRKLLLDPAVAPFREVFTGYEFHYYLAIRAARLKHLIKEIPVTRRYPSRGPTPTKIAGLGGNFEVMKQLWRACRHRFDPPKNPEAQTEA